MAMMTREAVEKINAKCKNGWKFDTKYHLFHNEKTVCKNIELDDDHYLNCQLYFSEKRANYRKVGWKVVLHISKFHRQGGGISASYGMGLFRDIPYDKERKMFSDLEKLTAVIDDNYIMEICNNKENQNRLIDNILLDKNGWHLHKV